MTPAQQATVAALALVKAQRTGAPAAKVGELAREVYEMRPFGPDRREWHARLLLALVHLAGHACDQWAAADPAGAAAWLELLALSSIDPKD